MIAQALLPAGLGLLVVAGHRPMALQRKYFEAHVERLRVAHPGRDEVWLRARASRYVSPPEVAPHVVGVAVDLTLCTANGAELWMGTKVNDTDTETCHTAHADIASQVRSHRALLIAALEGAGPVKLPDGVVALVLWRPLLGLHHRRAGRPLRAAVRLIHQTGTIERLSRQPAAGPAAWPVGALRGGRIRHTRGARGHLVRRAMSDRAVDPVLQERTLGRLTR